MPIIYYDGAPYFDHPLTHQEQLLYEKVVGNIFKPPVGMTSTRSWGRPKEDESRSEEEGHKDGGEA